MTRDSERIKEQILSLVRDYHAVTFGERELFVPGESRVPYAGRVFDEREMVNLVDSALEFWLTHGRYSEKFEADFAAYLGVPYALLVNSGSSANLLAFSALTSSRLGDRRIQPGDEVITVAAAFPTTVAPIIQHGAVPVFVDVTLPNADVDVSQLEAALSPRTKAVFLAHTLGNPFHLGVVMEFCTRHGLWLIEDNCDSLGSLYRGKQTGTFGHIGTSSFYPPHHMTMGEGGAAFTSDPLLNKIMLSMRDWGRDCVCPSGKDNVCGRRFDRQFGTLTPGYDHKYVYSEFGYNLKASDMQAAIGCAQLEKLPEFVSARRRNHAVLAERLAPLADRLQLPIATAESEPSWFGFLITVRPEAGLARDAITTHLEALGVQTRTLFAGNLVRQPCFDDMRATGKGFRVIGELPVTDRIMTDSFWIGVYPGMSEAMLEHMARTISSACGA